MTSLPPNNDSGLEVECPDCGSGSVEEDTDVVEDTAGRAYRVRVLICLECGRVFW